MRKIALSILILILTCTPALAAAEPSAIEAESEESINVDISSELPDNPLDVEMESEGTDEESEELLRNPKGINVYFDLNGFGSLNLEDGTAADKGMLYLGSIPAGTSIGDWLRDNNRSDDVVRLCNPDEELEADFKYWATSDGKVWDIDSSKVKADRKNYESDAFDSLTLYAKWTVNVKRIAGSTRYTTAISIADTLLEERSSDLFDSVIVAAGSNYPDALSGSSLAAATGAPILLVNPSTENSVYSYILKTLKPGADVYILGGSDVVSSRFENLVSDKFNAVRLSGKTRIDTNLAVINKVVELAGTQDIMLCTAYGYADSLSASATGKIIMLVGDTLTPSQKDWLVQNAQSKIYAIGGSDVLKETVCTETKDICGKTARRIAGNTRYDTSQMIAEKFFPESDSMILAVGDNFPDGLSGSSIALETNSPLVLATNERSQCAKLYASSADVSDVTVLGSDNLISNKVGQNMLADNMPIKQSRITTELLDSLDLEGYDKLMIVAHPDDETLWAGCHLAEDDYFVVCLTNGNNTTRRVEFGEAMTISNDRCLMLEYPDLTNGKRDNWVTCEDSIAEDIDTLLSYKEWDSITTHSPSGEYGHLHHILSNSILSASSNRNSMFDRLYYFELYFAKSSIPVIYKPNMSESSLIIRDQMADVYDSQISMVLYDHMRGYEALIKATDWANRNSITSNAYTNAA